MIKIAKKQDKRHFDEKIHTYYNKDGKVIKSTHALLERLGMIQPYKGDAWYGLRGTAVHRYLELYAQGLEEDIIVSMFYEELPKEVSWADCSEMIEVGKKYIDALKKKYDIVGIEKKVWKEDVPLHAQFAGTADLIVEDKKTKENSL